MYSGMGLALTIVERILSLLILLGGHMINITPSNQLVNLYRVRSMLAKACCLERLKEGNLLKALAMVKLMIKFKIISVVS
jgi:hypothetical protein